MIENILGNRLRLKIIIELYKTGEMTVYELVQKLGSHYKVLNKHLEVLETAGFVCIRWVGRMKLIKLVENQRILSLAKALAELDGVE